MNIFKYLVMIFSMVIISVSCYANNDKVTNEQLYCEEGNSLSGTTWIYEDANMTGFVINFISENMVSISHFKKNNNRKSEWDDYYVLVSENIYTYTLDNANGNSGKIWITEGSYKECNGTFAITGSKMIFMNKKQTQSWPLKKTNAVPDCF